MNKVEFKKALAIAKSDEPIPDTEMSLFDGFGLKNFTPVHCTLRGVAKLIRWQCQYMFGDGWDVEELNIIAHCSKKKFIIIG